MRASLILALMALTPIAGAQERSDNTGLDADFDSTVLVIDSEQDACLKLSIYLAITPDQRRQGLMFIRELPEDTGMLFVYEREALLSIWMKNTYIPLDIVFVASDGTPVNIHRNARPQTLDSRRAEEPARYVLEVNAGVADTLGLGPESRLMVELVEHSGN
ncbi:MAG: DUF192 domain-containing protein [Pseudomonadota bacterium]